MGKLHEVLAVEPDLKRQAVEDIKVMSGLFVDGVAQFRGLVRTYTPADEEGVRYPDEVTNLATTVDAELATFRASFGAWLDASNQKEVTNASTSADVEIDGKALLKGLPAPALLNLESKLYDLRHIYEAIPTNDLTQRWSWDEQREVWVSEPRITQKTEKIPAAIVGYEATKEHPAQVQYYTEDRVIGEWSAISFSGMWSPSDKRRVLANLDTLLTAVKQARQRANNIDAANVEIAETIFDFIHGS